MKKAAFAVSLLLALVGCSDDDALVVPDAPLSPDGRVVPDAATAADAGVDARVDPVTGPQFAAGDTAYCLAVGADYANGAGVLSGIALPSLMVTKNLLPQSTGSDPVIRATADKILVVNRIDANVTVIDKARFSVVSQFSTGPNSNPQDIAVIGDKAYVATLGTSSLQVWDLSMVNATEPETTIDLSAYDKVDGNPDANSVYIVGDKLYVTLELLDEFIADEGNGTVVVVDTTSDEIVANFTLTAPNPLNFIVQDGTSLYIDTAADFSSTIGCIEVIDTAAPSSAGCLVSNAALGGNPNGFAFTGDKTYVGVSSADFSSAKLVSVSGGAVSSNLVAETEGPGSVALAPNGYIVYSDGNAGGIRVFDPATSTEVTTSALDIGLPPAFASAIVCLPR